jgi:hypothetical protein
VTGPLDIRNETASSCQGLRGKTKTVLPHAGHGGICGWRCRLPRTTPPQGQVTVNGTRVLRGRNKLHHHRPWPDSFFDSPMTIHPTNAGGRFTA